MVGSPLLLRAGSHEERITRMGVARMTVAASVGVSPSFGARLFGAPQEQVTPATVLVGRLFAVRNAVLGAWTLTMRGASAEQRRRCFQLNAAVDIADLAVVLPALLRRDLRRAALMSSFLATSAALGWFELLREV